MIGELGDDTRPLQFGDRWQRRQSKATRHDRAVSSHQFDTQTIDTLVVDVAVAIDKCRLDDLTTRSRAEP